MTLFWKETNWERWNENLSYLLDWYLIKTMKIQDMVKSLIWDTQQNIY